MDDKKLTGATVVATVVEKKQWQIRGRGKSTGGKFNGKIWVAGKSSWQHTWQRKGKLALQAKAIAKQKTKLWKFCGKGPRLDT